MRHITSPVGKWLSFSLFPFHSAGPPDHRTPTFKMRLPFPLNLWKQLRRHTQRCASWVMTNQVGNEPSQDLLLPAVRGQHHPSPKTEPIRRRPHEDTALRSHPLSAPVLKGDSEASCSSPREVFCAFSQALSNVAIHIQLGHPAREKRQSQGLLRSPSRRKGLPPSTYFGSPGLFYGWSAGLS